MRHLMALTLGRKWRKPERVATEAKPGVPDRAPRPAVLDRFVPRPDAGGRHEIVVRAPSALVLDVAKKMDMQSVPMVRAIFWLRAKLFGSTERARPATGLVEEMLGLGWGRLAEVPGRYFVAGAACQPWQADVVFSPILAEQFATHAEANRVKIAWTLEVEPLGPELTRFATETRVAATDEQARRKFRRYWRRFRIGIVMIRLLLLPAVRREAERTWNRTRRSAAERISS